MQKQKRAEGSAGGWGRIWLGLCLLAFSAFLLAALLTYDPVAYARAWTENGVFFPGGERFGAFVGSGPGSGRGLLAGLYPDAGGGLGLWMAAFHLVLLGWVGAWGPPLILGLLGVNRLRARPLRGLLRPAALLLPLALSVLLAAGGVGGEDAAGTMGAGFYDVARSALGPVGAALLAVLAVAGSAVLAARLLDPARRAALGRALARVGSGFSRLSGFTLRQAWSGLRRGMAALRRYPWRELVLMSGRREPGPLPVPPAAAAAPRKAAHVEATAPAAPHIVDPDVEEVSAPSAEPAPARPVPPPERLAARTPRTVRLEPALPLDMETVVREARRRAGPGAAPAGPVGKAALPTAEILDDVPEIGPPVAEEELLENSRILTDTLRDFGVAGRVGEVHPGPVITRYEYAPGPGVRVAQILNRQDDLALKLRASRIRILAPIPGKAAVGIEIPNRHPSPIFLRRLLETNTFRDVTGPLPLALGRDIGGAPVVTELSRMPHLLIAGTTGSGKSVCVNALITSLLLKRTPEELRLLMIDPKMLELPMYNGIPHLLTEVVTDPRLAARTLKWLLVEMERRYRVLAARGCRNLQSYNSKVERDGPGEDGEGKLPYIVVFVDELADLMITSGKEVEEPIGRLAQTARAVGIHLIVATQRPSVDVITGVIKANFPARIAFQVASRTDSRTILDQNGAESLLGKGDMLFLPPGQAAPLRVHGAFVSESETQRLAEAWRLHGAPQVRADLEEALAEPEAGTGALGDDPLFEEAARLVVAAGQASASLLQRRLKVGYARAARLVDMMEMAGVVAPQDGSKPREILVDQVRLEHVLAGDER